MEPEAEIELLRKQLHEAQETLRAIREGEVDAFVMQSRGIYRVESLSDADTPYRVLVESLRGGALTVSSTGTLLFCNRGFSEKVGVDASDLVNTSVAKWLIVEPSLDALFAEALRGEAHAEGGIHAKTGFIPVSATACALPSESGAPLYCLVLMDLSDRVDAQRLRAEQALLERQRAELDAICRRLPFGVVLAEGPDLYRYCNPAVQQLMQTHAELRRHANQAVSKALKGVSIDEPEIRVGTDAAFRLHATPVTMEGTKSRALVVLQDVTAERQAQRTKEREEQLRETFVGILGHDLRTPLMAITSAVDLLENFGSGERVDQTVSRIRAAASRMRQLIDDMLDLTMSRIGGGIPVARQEVNLRDIVESVVDDLHATSQVEVELDVKGDTRGNWDAARLNQVVTNLCNNAVEHGSPASPVRIRLDALDPDRVVLAVTNEGLPIAPELFSTIFDPFSRGHGSRARGRGIGLGLFIADRIVAAHGGTISVRSVADGTTFTVVLPRTAQSLEGAPTRLSTG